MNDKMMVVAAGVPFVIKTNSSKADEVDCVMTNTEFSAEIGFGRDGFHDLDTLQKLVQDLTQSSEGSKYSMEKNFSIQVRQLNCDFQVRQIAEK